MRRGIVGLLNMRRAPGRYSSWFLRIITSKKIKPAKSTTMMIVQIRKFS
jgi:hypothetical protein